MPNGTGPEPCVCHGQPWPQTWKVVLEGTVSNDECADCNQFTTQSVFISLQAGIPCATWEDTGAVICNATNYSVLPPTGAAGNFTLQYVISFGPDLVTWEKTGVEVIGKEHVLPFKSQDPGVTDCDFSGATARLTPVGLSLDDFTAEDFQCFLALLKGCPPGTCHACLQALHVGGPTECCVKTQAQCDPDPCDCGEIPQLAKAFLLVNDCKCTIVGGCPSGRDSQRQNAAFFTKLEQLRQKLMSYLPHCPANSPSLNMSNGNLVFQAGAPNAGSFNPTLLLTYNSVDPTNSEYGYGWSGFLNRSITTMTLDQGGTAAKLADGTGAVYWHTDKHGASGLWLPPGGLRNSLKENADGTWLETQPDGFKMSYDASGQLQTMANASGNVWTLGYDAGDRVVSMVDPFDRRSTIAYDGNDKIKRLVDSGGRITTFTVDVSGNLTQHITPELCVTEFRYDAGHRMTAYVNPLGSRLSYAYDTRGWVKSIQSPEGQRTTFAWLDWNTTEVTDPAGNVTTLTYNFQRNIDSVTDPLGDTTQYNWDNNNLTGITDAKGNSYGVKYDALGNRTQALSAIAEPGGGTYSILYDSNDRVRTLIDQRGYRTTLVWDNAGNRTAVIDALGNRTSTLYNGDGRITASINPLGNRSSIVYDSVGEPVAYINPLGAHTTVTYENGVRHTVENPLGFVTTFQHDQMNRVTAWINPLGERTSYTYDTNGRLVETINPLGNRTTSLYTDSGKLEATINPLGYRMTLSYDSRGNLSTVRNALNEVSTTLYDSADRPIAMIDALNQRTTLGYNMAGLPVTMADPLGNITTTIYDSSNRLKATVAANSGRITLSYDAAGNRIALRNPLGNRTSTLFDALERPAATIDPLGNRTSAVYDAASRITASVSPLGCRTSLVYDDAGRTIATVDPLSNRTTRVYDAGGRSVAVVNALGYRTSTLYDAVGRNIASRDASGHRTSFVYDAASNRTATVRPDGGRISSIFDAGTRLIAFVDPNANRTTFTYDAVGRKTRELDPLENRVTFTYNAVSNRTLKINARGQRITSTYDGNGRETTTRFTDGTRVTFAYDSVGNRTLMHDSLGRYTSTFDLTNRLTTTVNPDGKQIDYRYDPRSLRSGMTDPDGGRTTYSYDSGSRVRSLLNPFSERTTWLYDAAGRTTLTYLGNSTRTSQTHDAVGQVTEITHFKSDDSVLAGQNYQYDPVGNKLRVAESTGDRVTWTYDTSNRLLSEHRTGTQPYRITHTYDLADNRTAKADTSGRTTFSYNAANELTTSLDASGTTTYSYDADGNQATKTEPSGDIRTNVWDSVNRLSSVILPAGARHTFVYAPTGLRVKADDGTDTTKFLWEAKNVLLETDASDVTQARYTLNPRQYGNLLSRRDGSTSRFYHFNQLGSTLLLSDETETPTSQYIYEAYGSMLAQPAGIANVFTFVGRHGYQFESPLDTYYMRARWYRPEIVAFLSRDPIGFVDGINPYQYARSMPMNVIDPSGEAVIVIPLAAVVAIGGAALLAVCLLIPQCRALLVKLVEAIVNGVRDLIASLVDLIKRLIEECNPRKKPPTCSRCPSEILYTNPIGPVLEQAPETCSLLQQTWIPPCWCFYGCPTAGFVSLPGMVG